MDGKFELAGELLGRFQRVGTLPTIRSRLKRLAGLGIGGAVAAFVIPLGGLSGVVLQLWAIIGLGLGGLSLLLWLSTKEFLNGWFDPRMLTMALKSMSIGSSSSPYSEC